MGLHMICLVWTILFTLPIEKGYDSTWNKNTHDLFEKPSNVKYNIAMMIDWSGTPTKVFVASTVINQNYL
jgi:hypothetical protein